ncbi:Uncharacterised protein [Kluyvera cryocrescens]|uniref:Uncharacterized protein n=1 Tax=Kluyvera cryocrescens TaxID=580 RepID=A0A485BGX5_KLUCR|nr:Uncharacterised protein [Kluyvera cryocrescens]
MPARKRARPVPGNLAPTRRNAREDNGIARGQDRRESFFRLLIALQP